MIYNGALAISLKTATTGVIDKLETWDELTVDEAAFLAAYQTKLGSGDTNAQDDLRFKFIFDRWYMRNIGK